MLLVDAMLPVGIMLLVFGAGDPARASANISPEIAATLGALAAAACCPTVIIIICPPPLGPDGGCWGVGCTAAIGWAAMLSISIRSSPASPLFVDMGSGAVGAEPASSSSKGDGEDDDGE
jgi:hypothetical protein